MREKPVIALFEHIFHKIHEKWQGGGFCTFDSAFKNGSCLVLIFKYDDWKSGGLNEGLTKDGMLILMFAFEITLKKINLLPLPLSEEQMEGYCYDMRPYEDQEICPEIGFEILKDAYTHFNHFHAGRTILKQIQ